MSKAKAILKLLSKLAEEGKAAKPLVKEGSQAGGALMREGQLAEGQKIAQKLTSGEDYAKKMASLKRAAGMAGAIGASSLISQEDAKAAGVATIAKKLGIALKDAKIIKEAAKKAKSAGEFEERINAIQTVRKFKDQGKRATEWIEKGQPIDDLPPVYKKIGSGADVDAYQVDDKVFKDPKNRAWMEKYEDDYLDEASYPAIMEQAGEGPKTTTVRTSKKQYQVQDKSIPLNKALADTTIDVRTLPEYKKLQDEKAALNLADSEGKIDIDEYYDRMGKINETYGKLLLKAIKDKKIDLPKSTDPESLGAYGAIEGVASEYEKTLLDKFKDIVRPRDVHYGNVGVTPKGKLEVFDTSRFNDPQFKNFSPELKKKILERYVGPPENKARMLERFGGAEPKVLEKPALPDTPSFLKKGAAAAAGAAVLGAPTEEAEAGIIGRKHAQRILNMAMRDGKLDIPELVKQLQFKPGKHSENLEKTTDILGHTILDRTGKMESEAMDAAQELYPHLDAKNMTNILPDDVMSKQYNSGVMGVASTPTLTQGRGGNQRIVATNPLETRIDLRQSVSEDPQSFAAILGHELQHGTEKVTFPNQQSIPYVGTEGRIDPGRIKERLLQNPELARDYIDYYNDTFRKNLPYDIIESLRPDQVNDLVASKPQIFNDAMETLSPEEAVIGATTKHHIQYPTNYELEKTEELINRGIVKPNDVEIAMYNKKANQMADYFKQNDPRRKAAAAMAAPMGVGESNMLSKPASQLADLYQEYVNKPVRAASEKIGESVGDALDMSKYMHSSTADLSQARDAMKDQTESIVKPGLKMAAEAILDPSNLLAPGAGIAVPLAAEAFATPEEERQPYPGLTDFMRNK